MKIFLACGGTGGHIFPAFSVAEELRGRDPRLEIIYLCGKKDIENAIFKLLRDEKVVSIESAPFRGALSLLNPIFLLKLLSGFLKSRRLLRAERPALVVGFGGHTSFPVVFAAKRIGVKTLIHEQNVVPGVANRWLAARVDGVALSFPDTRRYLTRLTNVRVTGNPIRSFIERDSREEALRFFGFDPAKTTLLVLGGSQGSESINQFCLEALKLLPESLRSKMQVLHLCGKMPVESAESVFRTLAIRGKAYSFFERMDLAYGVADLALGRAGATFLAELAVKGIPAILVPYPYGGGHQRVNADAYGSGHEATVVEQKDLNAQMLADLLVKRLAEAESKKKSPGFSGSRPQALARGTSAGAVECPALSRPLGNSRALLADFIEESLKKP